MINYFSAIIPGALILCCIFRTSNAKAKLMGCDHSNSTEQYVDGDHMSSGAILTDDSYVCADTHYMCPDWAEKGECQANDKYMLQKCPCSCHSCPIFINNKWDDEPQMAFGPLMEEIKYVIKTTEAYMVEFRGEIDYGDDKGDDKGDDDIDAAAAADDDDDDVSRIKCRNKFKGCSHWSLFGDCITYSSYMRANCGPACRECAKIGEDEHEKDKEAVKD